MTQNTCLPDTPNLFSKTPATPAVSDAAGPYTEKDIQKWTLKVKLTKKAKEEITGKIYKLKSLIYTSKELNGVIGGETRENLLTQLVGITVDSQYNLDKYVEVGKKFNWEITDGNIVELNNEIKTAIEEGQKHIPVNDHRITPEEYQKREEENNKRHEEYKRREAQAKTVYESLKAKAPAGAVGIIIAEINEDISDSQTDYFDERAVAAYAIGWKMTKKENFLNLRKAAARFPETAHMGPGKDMHSYTIYYADTVRKYMERNLPQKQSETFPTREATEAEAKRICEEEDFGETMHIGEVEYRREIHFQVKSYEQRENYSMGGGNYLGSGRYGGWKVYSRAFGNSFPDNLTDKIDECSKNTVPANNTAANTEMTSINGKTISINEGKNGIEIKFDEKPSTAVLEKLKGNKWRWSKFSKIWYNVNTPENLKFAQEI